MLSNLRIYMLFTYAKTKTKISQTLNLPTGVEVTCCYPNAKAPKQEVREVDGCINSTLIYKT